MQESGLSQEDAAIQLTKVNRAKARARAAKVALQKGRRKDRKGKTSGNSGSLAVPSMPSGTSSSVGRTEAAKVLAAVGKSRKKKVGKSRPLSRSSIESDDDSDSSDDSDDEDEIGEDESCGDSSVLRLGRYVACCANPSLVFVRPSPQSSRFFFFFFPSLSLPPHGSPSDDFTSDSDSGDSSDDSENESLASTSMSRRISAGRRKRRRSTQQSKIKTTPVSFCSFSVALSFFPSIFVFVFARFVFTL